MVRTLVVDDDGMRKGAWTREEDARLRNYIQQFGHWNWRLLPKYAGLARTGKSCRLRWTNYLKPGLKRGKFSHDEHDLILKLHAKLGNKWSAMALELPGRTDNEIKNYWHGHIAKRSRKGNRAAKSFNEGQEFKSNLFVLESSQVPCQSNSNTTSESHEASGNTTSESDEVLAFPEYVKEAEISTGGSKPEPQTWDFWTEPFKFDTETEEHSPEVMDFWPELPPLDTQDCYSPPLLLEEHLQPLCVGYYDLSSFDHAINLLYYA